KFIQGLIVKYSSASQITIGAGACRDSTNAYTLAVSGTLTVDITASGANGLDTGSEASNTWYYVYVIGDSTGVNTPKGLLSVTNESSSGAITLPSGYDLKRQLPIAIRNNASSNILNFVVAEGWPYRP